MKSRLFIILAVILCNMLYTEMRHGTMHELISRLTDSQMNINNAQTRVITSSREQIRILRKNQDVLLCYLAPDCGEEYELVKKRRK